MFATSIPLIHETFLTTRGTYFPITTSIPTSQLFIGTLAASFALTHIEFAMIAAAHHMVNGSGIFEAQLAGHGLGPLTQRREGQPEQRSALVSHFRLRVSIFITVQFCGPSGL